MSARSAPSSVRTPPFTPRRPSTSGRTRYTAVEIAEGASGGLDAVAVGAAALPGFLLTVPGIVLVLVPVVALGLLATLAAVVAGVAVVLALAGAWMARRTLRALPTPGVPRVPALVRRARPTARRPAL